MEFVYEPELIEYMKKKGRYHIVVELVSIEHSDIEMTDIHVYLANERQYRLFLDEKKYKSVKTNLGDVLLPKYKFEMDEKIIFGLKKRWIFHTLTCRGIRL